LPVDYGDFSNVPKTIQENTRHKWVWSLGDGSGSRDMISLAASPTPATPPGKKEAQAANDPGAEGQK